MPSLFKSIIEPVIIITTFTVGTIINRRHSTRNSTIRQDIEQTPYIDDDGSLSDSTSSLSESDSSLTSATSSASSSPPLKPTAIVRARQIKLRSERFSGGGRPGLVFDLLSRFFNKFPFLVEIWYWLLTYWIYQLLRAFSARMIAGNLPIFERARDHAIQILNFEHMLGVDVELRFQRYIMNDLPGLMPSLARIYYSHICVGVGFLVYMYTFTPLRTFQRVRRTIALDNVIAFVIVTLWRCSPPRLLPAEYGFVDVLHKKSATGDGNAWTNNRFQLTIAAMPSLHFGTSLLFAVCLWRFSPHRWMRVLAPLWPMGMLVTIVATANHFLADAAVGAMIPFISWRYNHLILKLVPLQTWLFGSLTRKMDLVTDEGEDGVAEADLVANKPWHGD